MNRLSQTIFLSAALLAAPDGTFDLHAQSKGRAPKTAPARPNQNPATRTIKADIPWRTVIETDIADPALKAKVEGFLDYFQKTAFAYEQADPQTGKLARQELSGQKILDNMQAIAEGLSDPAFINKFPQVRQLVPHGKFVIAEHDRPYNRANIENTSAQVLWLGSRRGNVPAIPVKIEIGAPYLKGAQYTGEDQKLHPVSVDSVLVYTLVSAADLDPTGERGSTLEAIVTQDLGGVPRGKPEISFLPNSNGGYVTLYDRPRAELRHANETQVAAAELQHNTF